MSENECGFGSERCAAICRTVVGAGVVAIMALLVVVIVMLIPGWQNARVAQTQQARRAELAKAYVKAGDAAFASAQYADALTQYIVAASMNPGDPDTGMLVSRARIAAMAANPSSMDEGDVLQIRNEAALVAAAFPADMANVDVVLAMMKFRENRIPEALALLEEAGKADTAGTVVHLARALLWRFVPDKASVIDAEYDAAVAARPEDPLVLGFAGQHFLAAEDSAAKGLELLKKASATVSNVNWLKTIAAATMQSGEKEGAMKYVNEAYALAPRDPEVLNLLAQALMNARELDRAAAVLRQSLSIKETRDTMFQLAVVLNQMGRFEQALPLLAKVNQSGSDVMSTFEYANALAGIGKKDDALKIYASIAALKTEGMQGVQGQIVAAIKERAAEAVSKIGAPAAK